MQQKKDVDYDNLARAFGAIQQKDYDQLARAFGAIEEPADMPGVTAQQTRPGTVDYHITATNTTIPLPVGMPAERVRQIVEGHVRAYERGYRDTSMPKKTNEQAAWERSGIPQIIGAIKEAELRIGKGGQYIREKLPIIDRLENQGILPAIPYHYAAPSGPAEEAGIPLERVAEVAVPLVVAGVPRAAGASVAAVGRTTLTAWNRLPPALREQLIKGAIRGAGFTGAAGGSYALLKKLGVPLP